MILRYELHGVRFAIEAARETAEQIADFVLPSCRTARHEQRPHAAFAVRDDDDRLAVRRGRRVLWHAADAEELVPWLEGEVVRWLLGRLRGYGQIHAAAVERDGRAIVLAGGPDSGKTSLACAFGLAGWGVMSDEVALVEADGRHVRSFPRMMFVEDETARRLPELATHPRRRIPVAGGTATVRPVSPAGLGPGPRARATVAGLVFVQRGGPVRCAPLSERHAIELLLPLSFSAAERPRRTLDVCLAMVRSAPAWEMKAGRLAAAVELVSGRLRGA
ncbi:MAG: hypothetical protein ACOC70_00025 [bacterium]